MPVLPDKLVFVYNARSGLLHAFIDLLHKNLSPRTYPCQLCAVTYNNTGMLPDWKQFARQFPVPVIFLHKDELIEAYGQADYLLPAAYADFGGVLHSFITADAMRAVRTVEELKALTQQQFANYRA